MAIPFAQSEQTCALELRNLLLFALELSFSRLRRLLPLRMGFPRWDAQVFGSLQRNVR